MKVTIAVTQENPKYWIGRCLEFMITQTGKTRQEAIEHTIESLKQMHKDLKIKQVKIDESQYRDDPDWEIVEIEIELG